LALLAKAGKQGGRARGRPPTDRERSAAPRDINALAHVQYNAPSCRRTTDGYAPAHYEDGRCAVFDIDSPARTTHGGYRLWRNDLEAIRTPSSVNVHEDGFVSQGNSVWSTVSVSIDEVETRPAFGGYRDAIRTAHDLPRSSGHALHGASAALCQCAIRREQPGSASQRDQRQKHSRVYQHIRPYLYYAIGQPLRTAAIIARLLQHAGQNVNGFPV